MNIITKYDLEEMGELPPESGWGWILLIIMIIVISCGSILFALIK